MQRQAKDIIVLLRKGYTYEQVGKALKPPIKAQMVGRYVRQMRKAGLNLPIIKRGRKGLIM